eukprot:CAMPEP_0184325332 /NCGR_PEP_ID=MMETSP1049-20130417/139861_1 /TAXON_ID=77928 /ORGANISM="Proteomonas sulcata, Strain CCMP704" /LENGTH=251 /DNA_ID=CAMNT_0026647357 /DNA_START=200 /DNA_END=955 /DNA_ORIENTATION=+
MSARPAKREERQGSAPSVLKSAMKGIGSESGSTAPHRWNIMQSAQLKETHHQQTEQKEPAERPVFALEDETPTALHIRQITDRKDLNIEESMRHIFRDLKIRMIVVYEGISSDKCDVVVRFGDIASAQMGLGMAEEIGFDAELCTEQEINEVHHHFLFHSETNIVGNTNKQRFMSTLKTSRSRRESHPEMRSEGAHRGYRFPSSHKPKSKDKGTSRKLGAVEAHANRIPWTSTQALQDFWGTILPHVGPEN